MNRLSIITPTLNSSATIERCFESILSQNISLEHIIVDGGSSDTTVDRIRAHEENAPDEVRVKWVSQSDDGIYDAMNRGLQMASGDVIGILNGDDQYAHPEVLARVLSGFEATEVNCCYGDLVYVRQENAHEKISRYWKAGTYHRSKLYAGWMPPHPTFFARKGLYETHGLFRMDLGSAADYELMLRFLLGACAKPVYLPCVMVKMGLGGVSSSSLRARWAAHRMDRKAWTVNGLAPRIWTLPLKPLRKIGQWWPVPKKFSL